MISLGKLYERGLGVSKDTAEARVWYRKAQSAKDADKAKPGSAQ
jgi:TPR repeat protein